MIATAAEFIEQLPVAAIISDIESHQIVYLNTIAREYFHETGSAADLTSIELLKLHGEDLEWYLSVTPSLQIEKFQDIYADCKLPYPVILDCCAIQHEGKIFRLDTINTKSYEEISEYNIYSYAFERSVNKLEKLYKGNASLDENISDILDLVLYVYAGDRAFVYELDEDLCCTVDLYERCRKGFEAYNEKYKTVDKNVIEFLMSRLENGEAYTAVTEENEDDIIRQRMEEGLVIRNMSAPFTCRSGLKCFLCIDNPRRFWHMDSFLKYASYLLANDLHTNKIQGHLEASYLLNKSLTDTNENLVKIYMFGGFEIQTSNGLLQDGSFRSPQVCSLISFLLLNRKRMLSIYEISDAIWPDQIIDNPYNQIKNVVFRARKALEGVCKVPLIEAKDGTYTINNNLDIWIDTEEFERLYKKAGRKDLPTEQRLSLYQRAFQLYRGGMLPFMEPELWLLTRINYYQILYTNMINEYLQLLSDNDKYMEAFSVASTAIAIEPSNFDVYGILLESLLKNNHDDLARKYYQKISIHLAKNQKEQFRQMWNDLNENR